MANKTTRDPSNPLDEVSFICRPCAHPFVCNPLRVEDKPEKTTHPFAYFANCPKCGEECKQQPWEQGLMASYGKQTGPKTPEGKAKSAKNIDGYPTPEQTKRTRFNALKHAMYAETLQFFPARPGQYLQCGSCQIDHDVCRSNTICAKEADRAMRYQIAFSENNPNQLRDIQANNQARFQSIMDNIILSLINTGTELRSPVWYQDNKGNVQFVEYKTADGETHPVVEIKANPLLKSLGDFISKNNLSMADMGMTPKLNEEEQPLQGNLVGAQNKGDELLSYASRQADALEGLREMIENSKKKSDSDPILIEHGAQ